MAFTFNFLSFKIWQDSFFNRSIFSFPFYILHNFYISKYSMKKKKEKNHFIRLLCLSLSFYNIIPYFFLLSFFFSVSYSLCSRYSLINVGLTVQRISIPQNNTISGILQKGAVQKRTAGHWKGVERQKFSRKQDIFEKNYLTSSFKNFSYLS